ncbi:threonine/homoserine exporter RhtA [Pseudoxanthomonas sp.]|uniref:threonine/homoserine exporter RhtA n=1 Tax=Pseudoxanthomonas sp. TaxID=1871049 RepID=UPI0026130BE7|nr:threonine/homoserine exporter RhtA [Pseudoxanthomonas sp.]WDS37301.1 MAG: threonine/homoserine exporter RhtA [Pseudoxanthomonas sp.]
MSAPSSFRTSSILYPVALLLVSMLSIQAGASLAKSLFPAIGATGATALRLGFGTVLLWVVFRPWKMDWRALPWPMLLGYGLSLGTMNTLFYIALQTVPLGLAVALEFTGPLAVAVLGSRRPRDLVWAGLAIAGLLLLVPWPGSQAALDPVGMACALGAGVCWALYILFGQKAGAEHGAQTVALGSTIACVVAVPWGVAHAGMALFTPALLPAALGVAVLSMALPYSLEMMALTRLPARTFGMLMSLEPALGALCGMLLLHEQLRPLQWLAIVAVIAASAGATLGARAPVTAPVPD